MTEWQSIERSGWIEVVVGCMFSGKTEELIRRLKRALIAQVSVQVFKPRIDQRYALTEVASHAGRVLEAVAVDSTDEVRARLRPDTRVVGIDEAQFFDETLVELAEELASDGRRVIVAGLDLDYLGRPFGCVPALMARAEYVTKTLAICVLCGNPASRSHRTTHEPTGVVQVGAAEAYQPLCRCCFARERDAADARSRQTALDLTSGDLAAQRNQPPPTGDLRGPSVS